MNTADTDLIHISNDKYTLQTKNTPTVTSNAQHIHDNYHIHEFPYS